MMYRTQILLRPEQHKILSEIASQERRSLSEIIREMIDKQVVARQQKALVAAAQALLADYQTDAELTAFQVLDGDDFHA